MKRTVTLILKTKVVIEVENGLDAVRQAKAIATEMEADEIEIDNYIPDLDKDLPLNLKYKE